MKIQLTYTIRPEIPSGWDTAADAEDTKNRLLEEALESYEGNGVAFSVTDVEAKVIEP